MAQVIARTLLATALALAINADAQDVPEAGIAAETRMDWSEAARIYRQALAEHPDDAGLWQRLAQVQAAAGDASAAADAYGHAAALLPKDAALQARHSSALAVANRPAEALAAIERALKLAPGDREYLRSHAVLANWNRRHHEALESYRRVLESEPGDPPSLLGAARAARAVGERDAASGYYREYLDLLPQQHEVMLEYMAHEAESGEADILTEYDRLYRQQFGASKDYWIRLAELYTAAGDRASSLASLERATELPADDPALYYRLAEAYADKDDPGAAAAAIERAVALSPTNVQYLEARANYASWRGDYPTALDSYERILAIEPDNLGAWLGKARVNYWQGALRKSDLAYREYLSRQSNVPVVWLEHARVFSELGDFAKAVSLIDDYEDRFGDYVESRREKARIYAWAGRRHQALVLNTPLLEAAPEDYGLNYTQVLALRQGQIPALARPSLQRVQRIQPESRETGDLVRSTRIPLASKADAWFDFFEDSDDIRTLHYGVDASWIHSDRLRLLAAVNERRVRAPNPGPFAPDSGGNGVHDRRGTLGLRYALDADHALTARAGVSDLDSRGTKGVFSLELQGLQSDTYVYLLSLERDRVAVSPRSLDRSITSAGGHGRLQLTPDLRNSFDIEASYHDYSDGNERVHVTGGWGRAVLRRPHFMFDLGLNGEWLHFDLDNDNGYYSPDSYRRIGGVASAYVPFDDDSGLSVQLGLGIQRDETFDEWERASDISFEYTRGIFRDWQIKIRAGYTERVQSTGAFEGSNFGIEIERRF